MVQRGRRNGKQLRWEKCLHLRLTYQQLCVNIKPLIPSDGFNTETAFM